MCHAHVIKRDRDTILSFQDHSRPGSYRLAIATISRILKNKADVKNLLLKMNASGNHKGTMETDSTAHLTREMIEDTSKFLSAARRGSLPHIRILGKDWQTVPDMLSLGVLDIFLQFLDISLLPDPSEEEAERAFLSIVGLGRGAPNHIPDMTPYAGILSRGFAGVVGWSLFHFNTRVGAAPASNPLAYVVTTSIALAWQVIYASSTPIEPTMLNMPGSIELLCELWLREDIGPPALLTARYPVASAVLSTLISHGGPRVLDRMIASPAAKREGGIRKIVKLAMMRLEDAKSKMSPATSGYYDLPVQIVLMNNFCATFQHPLHLAFLEAGVVTSITEILVLLSKFPLMTKNVVTMLRNCISYLKHDLDETTAAPYVAEAIRAGLITGLRLCSQFLPALEDQATQFLIHLLQETIPKYLVYYSILKLVLPELDAFLGKHATPMPQNTAYDAWKALYSIAQTRMVSASLMPSNLIGSKAEAACANAECRKIDVRSNFKRCSRCLRLYCSVACQKYAWRHGHRETCAASTESVKELAALRIAKEDLTYINWFSRREAFFQLPQLREYATKTDPNTPWNEFTLRVDWTSVPPKTTAYLVRDQEKYSYHKENKDSEMPAAVFDGSFAEEVLSKPGKYALLETVVPNRSGLSLTQTLIEGDFWTQKVS
ncbi:hypothetical protein B0H10DRAFT_1078879 [Mycena sp. CBHHK59/15]|nr:hypothetical protein B0H10DRAFT_1078879 [Mycena sp. CBHHK59/15]